MIRKKPSEIIAQWRKAERLNWTYGLYDEVLLLDGEALICHCQAGFLSEYATTHGFPRYDWETVDVYLCRAYDLTAEQVQRAIGINDDVSLDGENDGDLPRGLYAYLQREASPALERVQAYYESIGR